MPRPAQNLARWTVVVNAKRTVFSSMAGLITVMLPGRYRLGVVVQPGSLTPSTARLRSSRTRGSRCPYDWLLNQISHRPVRGNQLLFQINQIRSLMAARHRAPCGIFRPHEDRSRNPTRGDLKSEAESASVLRPITSGQPLLWSVRLLDSDSGRFAVRAPVSEALLSEFHAVFI